MPQILDGHPVLAALKTKLAKATERPCYPKVRYPDAHDADRALDAMHAKGKGSDGDKTLSRYHCRFCDGFHLGRTRTSPMPTPGAPEQGNVGTVSFEDAAIGEHAHATNQRKLRRRNGAVVEIPPKRTRQVEMTEVVTPQGERRFENRAPTLPASTEEIEIWACSRCGAQAPWPSVTGRHEPGCLGTVRLLSPTRAADPRRSALRAPRRLQ